MVQISFNSAARADLAGLRFGIFLAPFHQTDENPTLALHRDLELMEHLDRLGFDEAWIGEHHSGGLEIIASPEVFIAAAAARTKRIKLGTGVASLPYHHPLVLADRIVQLDHQTSGRTMFGVGAGALPSDVHMMGHDPLRVRGMMEESLDALMPLLRGEIVNAKTDWFTLRDARCQLSCFTRPHMEIAVAVTTSPAGAKLAGKHGVGVLSISATTEKGFEALAATWDAWSTVAAQNGKSVNRAQWRLVSPVHIAETREQARANMHFGLQQWVRYFNRVGALPVSTTGQGSVDSDIDAMIASGLAVIGTPEDLIRQIERLWEKSGGFGCWLDLAHNWADVAATRRSYELIARYVVPHFRRANQQRIDALEWAASNRAEFIGRRTEAMQQEIAKWQGERRKGG
ncbi:MAG: LLM class flavin-dependent oxidoreductase [Alphaproteobacteria bacterium]